MDSRDKPINSFGLGNVEIGVVHAVYGFSILDRRLNVVRAGDDNFFTIGGKPMGNTAPAHSSCSLVDAHHGDRGHPRIIRGILGFLLVGAE